MQARVIAAGLGMVMMYAKMHTMLADIKPM